MIKSPKAQRLKPCMPPLLEEETKRISGHNGTINYSGTACENIVKSYFLSKSINIAQPYVDDGVDLLIEKPEGWVKGQVKKVIYQFKLDYNHRKNFGRDIYRSRFGFNFQSGGESLANGGNGTKQRGPETSDYYYHVLLTPYRHLIWETPVSLIPLREDGNFIFGKNAILERNSFQRRKPDIDYSELLVYSRYDPIIFKTYPEFFIKEESITLDEFFDYDK